MKDKSVQIGVRCDVAVVEILTAYAEENDLTLSWVVRKALREYAAELKALGALGSLDEGCSDGSGCNSHWPRGQ